MFSPQFRVGMLVWFNWMSACRVAILFSPKLLPFSVLPLCLLKCTLLLLFCVSLNKCCIVCCCILPRCQSCRFCPSVTGDHTTATTTSHTQSKGDCAEYHTPLSINNTKSIKGSLPAGGQETQRQHTGQVGGISLLHVHCFACRFAWRSLSEPLCLSVCGYHA